MDAAYNVQWYNHSTKFKKMLQMVIMRAQCPCLLQTGPIFSATMEHFKDVSHMSLCNFMNFFIKSIFHEYTGSMTMHSEKSLKLRVNNSYIEILYTHALTHNTYVGSP